MIDPRAFAFWLEFNAAAGGPVPHLATLIRQLKRINAEVRANANLIDGSPGLLEIARGYRHLLSELRDDSSFSKDRVRKSLEGLEAAVSKVTRAGHPKHDTMR